MLVNLNELIAKSVLEGITRLNVAAIIVNQENKILLCQRNKNKKIAPGSWHMPGGKVEEGETIEEAITRELMEELGIRVLEIIGFSNVQHDYAFKSEKHRTVFIGVEAEGKIRMNPENDACAFVSPKEIPSFLEPDLVTYNEQAATYGIERTSRKSEVLLP